MYGRPPQHIQKVIGGKAPCHVSWPKIRLQASQRVEGFRGESVPGRGRQSREVLRLLGLGDGTLCPTVPSVQRERMAKIWG